MFQKKTKSQMMGEQGRTEPGVSQGGTGEVWGPSFARGNLKAKTRVEIMARSLSLMQNRHKVR